MSPPCAKGKFPPSPVVTSPNQFPFANPKRSEYFFPTASVSGPSLQEKTRNSLFVACADSRQKRATEGTAEASQPHLQVLHCDVNAPFKGLLAGHRPRYLSPCQATCTSNIELHMSNHAADSWNPRAACPEESPRGHGFHGYDSAKPTGPYD